LKQLDLDGSFEYSYEIEVDIMAPAVYALEQNYPNPFNPSTSIDFSIAEANMVKIAVYNLLGQEVKVLLNEFKEAGPHTIQRKCSWQSKVFLVPSGNFAGKLIRPKSKYFEGGFLYKVLTIDNEYLSKGYVKLKRAICFTSNKNPCLCY